MEVIEVMNNVRQLVEAINSNVTVGSNFIANATSIVDPALAPCYHTPYGGIGMIMHLALAWATSALCLGRRPFMPYAHLSHPIIGFVFCSLSFLAFCVIPITSNGLSDCGEPSI